jgi:hypothetical protein
MLFLAFLLSPDVRTETRQFLAVVRAVGTRVCHKERAGYEDCLDGENVVGGRGGGWIIRASAVLRANRPTLPLQIDRLTHAHSSVRHLRDTSSFFSGFIIICVSSDENQRFTSYFEARLIEIINSY